MSHRKVRLTQPTTEEQLGGAWNLVPGFLGGPTREVNTTTMAATIAYAEENGHLGVGERTANHQDNKDVGMSTYFVYTDITNGFKQKHARGGKPGDTWHNTVYKSPGPACAVERSSKKLTCQAQRGAGETFKLVPVCDSSGKDVYNLQTLGGAWCAIDGDNARGIRCNQIQQSNASSFDMVSDDNGHVFLKDHSTTRICDMHDVTREIRCRSTEGDATAFKLDFVKP